MMLRPHLKAVAFAAVGLPLMAQAGCRPARSPAPVLCQALGPAEHVRALYDQHGQPLVVLGDTVWLCPCGAPRRVAGDVETRDVAGANEPRHVAGSTEARTPAGDDERRRIDGDDESRRLGGDLEVRRDDGDAERRRLGGDAEDRRDRGDAEARQLGGRAEDRRLGGQTETPTCAVVETCPGYVVHHGSPEVSVFDGWNARTLDNHCVVQ